MCTSIRKNSLKRFWLKKGNTANRGNRGQEGQQGGVKPPAGLMLNRNNIRLREKWAFSIASLRQDNDAFVSPWSWQNLQVPVVCFWGQRGLGCQSDSRLDKSCAVIRNVWNPESPVKLAALTELATLAIKRNQSQSNANTHSHPHPHPSSTQTKTRSPWMVYVRTSLSH